MQMKRLKPPQTRCVVKRRSAAVLRRSKAEREAVLRGDKIKRSGAPNSLPGRLTCTRPGGCLPGFALRSLRLSPLFFLPTPPQIYSFIYLSAYRATSALRISSVPLGRVTRAPRCSKHTCVCGGAAKMPHPAAWWSPPTNLPHPAKGKSEDEASRRRAPPCTSSPHTGHISGEETVSEEREKKFKK